MILTIPNVISTLRILAVPLFLWLLFGRDDPAAAGWLLGVLGATDWVDGWLARRLGQVSELGKLLDPIGDRMAIAAALVGGWISGALPWWIALLLIVRESGIALGALLAASKAGAQLEVRLVGKAATMALYIAIANFFIYAGTEHLFFGTVAWTFVGPGLVLYYVAAVQYFGDLRRILAGDRTVSSDQRRAGGAVEVPEELRYSEDHEWVRIEDGLIRVGITDFAQDALGEVVFVGLPEVGSHYDAGDLMAEVESTKSIGEVYAPVAGTVRETNSALAEVPELVNTGPYGEGWLVVIEPDSLDAVSGLLDAAAYGELTA